MSERARRARKLGSIVSASTSLKLAPCVLFDRVGMAQVAIISTDPGLFWRRCMLWKRLAIGVFSCATISAFGVGAASCARSGEAAGEVAPSSAIGLRVRNNNFLDMDVYAVSAGLATRLGTVTGNSTRNFVLDGSLATPDLRIVATPIGGNGRASTGQLLVTPGQVIDFTIGAMLNNSNVIIR